MIKITVLTVVIILAGLRACPPESVCELECMGAITSDNPISCEAVAFDMELAMEGFVQAQIFSGRTEACERFKSTELHISSKRRWHHWGREVIGHYSYPTVTVNLDADSLAHELLHDHQFRDGDIFTFLHSGWDDNNFNWVADEWYRPGRKSPSD